MPEDGLELHLALHEARGIPPREPPRWRVTAGWSAVATGAVALGLGAVFWASAADAADVAEGLPPAQRPLRRRLEDDYESSLAGMWISIGLGTALVATGGVLLGLDEAPATGESR